ncbi:MAG: 1,2-phenylacetyl-CoA epoxidase subunit PaaD [Nitratireductor sp.]
MVGDTHQTTLPNRETVLDWLEEVPDPEIPVISLVDLGIVRDVSAEGDKLVVTVTPTYSGCPATSIINFEIGRALSDHGISEFEIRRQLSPAWRTEWISQKGRAALLEYGIAPPIEGTAACGTGAPKALAVACPRCKSPDTEMISRFGSTPCKASWRCKACLEPFDYFKCI